MIKVTAKKGSQMVRLAQLAEELETDEVVLLCMDYVKGDMILVEDGEWGVSEWDAEFVRKTWKQEQSVIGGYRD